MATINPLNLGGTPDDFWKQAASIFPTEWRGTYQEAPTTPLRESPNIYRFPTTDYETARYSGYAGRVPPYGEPPPGPPRIPSPNPPPSWPPPGWPPDWPPTEPGPGTPPGAEDEEDEGPGFPDWLNVATEGFGFDPHILELMQWLRQLYEGGGYRIGAGTPRGFDEAFDLIRRRLGELEEPRWSPTDLQILQTQAIEPLEGQRQAQRQQAIERMAALGHGKASGTIEQAVENVDRTFNQLRSITERELTSKQMETEEGRKQERVALGQLMAQLGNQVQELQLRAAMANQGAGGGILGALASLTAGGAAGADYGLAPYQAQQVAFMRNQAIWTQVLETLRTVDPDLARELEAWFRSSGLMG